MFSAELLYKIAVFYYQEQLTQEEIAQKVGISRPKVSRALDRARELGIVKIEIVRPGEVGALEEEIQKALNLKKVAVAPPMNCTGNDYEDRLNDVAEYGARFLEQNIAPGSVIGMGWGKTVYKTTMDITSRQYPLNVKLVPLVGSLGRTEPHFQVNIIVNSMAAKFGGNAFYYNVSTLMAYDEKELADIREEYSDIFSLWKNLDIAVVGLGAFGEKPSFPVCDYRAEELDQLSQKQASGDLLGRFFNSKGYIDLDQKSQYIGVPTEDLRNAGQIICLASGKTKINSIIVASKLGLFNSLIIDEKTAVELLNQLKESE